MTGANLGRMNMYSALALYLARLAGWLLSKACHSPVVLRLDVYDASDLIRDAAGYVVLDAPAVRLERKFGIEASL